MIMKYTTNRDKSGNRCTLVVDTDKKEFVRGYNSAWSYSDFVTITKKDRDKIVNLLTENGYKPKAGTY